MKRIFSLLLCLLLLLLSAGCTVQKVNDAYLQNVVETFAPGNGYYCAACKPSTPAGKPSSSGGGKCIVCNGTGYVKYYYGSSDLEVHLSGHDPYWYGQCASCNGTGRD